MFLLLVVGVLADSCCDDEERRLFVSRQGHGTNQDCSCKKSTSKNSVWLIVCVIGAFVCIVATICAGLALIPKSQPENEIEMARTSLKTAQSTSDLCPVCLDTLDGAIVHPPNCDHVFHVACIEQWLETNARRSLLCPTCAASMLPI